uniref:Minor capsid protein L2 n=1 Tax=Bat papillomavirus TaxID=2004707 RepID=A0A2Z2JMV6_9PAPI|nr:L2 [Bat papillomavirus]
MTKNGKTRVRRADPKDLFRKCQLGADCPQDIKDKFTQNTWADWLLKFGSLGTYFGNLGIGTGRASTILGRLPARVNPGAGVDVGGVDVGVDPIRVVPQAPPVSIGPGEGAVVEEIPMVPLGPFHPARPPPTLLPGVEEHAVDLADFGIGHVPRTIEPPRFGIVEPGPALPTPEIVGTGGAEGEETVAIISTTPEGSVVSRTQFNNPLFDVTITATNTSGETSSIDHIIVTETPSPNIVGLRGGFGMDTVPIRPSAEDIELQDFTVTSSDLGYPEETQFASTPKRGTTAPRPERITRFGNRRQLLQRPIEEPEFLSRPQDLVRYQNPAYDPDVDLIFTEDLEEVYRGVNPPHEDFRDIITLSAPIYSEAPGGGLRVSRIGQRASIQTRSGLHIGAATHFYRDISAIAGPDPLIPEDAIELSVLGESSGDNVIANGIDESEFVSIDLNEPETAIYQGDLLDEFEDVRGVEEISILADEDETTRIVPAVTARPFPGEAPGDFLVVHYPEDTGGYPPIYPDETPWVRITPSGGYSYSVDYYLHPALYQKKKRRRYYLKRKRKRHFF